MQPAAFNCRSRDARQYRSRFSEYAWCSCFWLPLSNLIFLATGPHPWDEALLWTCPVWVCILLDWLGPRVNYRPPLHVSPRLYLGVLHLLALLQFASILLLLRDAERLTWGSPPEWLDSAANLIAMRIVTGTTSCCSGIALAHELIHRSQCRLRFLGRAVLWTVLYDHFAASHVQGHHRYAATAQDCSTARRGESFQQFWRRSVTGQWCQAWRQERAVLRSASPSQWWAASSMYRGLAVQCTLLLIVAAAFGPVALAIFVYQALAAVRLLEAVNYFQHWGLKRMGRSVGPTDAWATRSWWSLHSLLGLPLHADHHIHPGRPFYRLEILDSGPELPHGYFVTAVLVRVANGHWQRAADQRLGKFIATSADTQARSDVLSPHQPAPTEEE